MARSATRLYLAFLAKLKKKLRISTQGNRSLHHLVRKSNGERCERDNLKLVPEQKTYTDCFRCSGTIQYINNFWMEV